LDVVVAGGVGWWRRIYIVIYGRSGVLGSVVSMRGSLGLTMVDQKFVVNELLRYYASAKHDVVYCDECLRLWRERGKDVGDSWSGAYREVLRRLGDMG
jgi:hypothetical protein